MKNLQDWAAVQQVYKQTKSIRATARILGISRNTVKRLLKLKEMPAYKRRKSKTILDKYAPEIEIWRDAEHDFNGTRIFRELKKIGYEGSKATLYRYLKRINEKSDNSISKRATVRHESPPGDQAQFDWSEYQVLVGNRYRTVYCFALILAASRKKAVCFSLKEDAESIYEAIQELFDEMGGVTLELLIDNPKALVIKNDPKSENEIKYNPYALLMAKHLGTELNACPCYWPRKKGKIERPFNYIEQQFIKGSSFANMEELNRRGKEFVNNWCNELHSTTKRIPNEHYIYEERETLLPLPKKHYYISAPKEKTVNNEGRVFIDTNKYSVPIKYAEKNVLVRVIYGFRICIYDKKGNQILNVEACDGKHQELTNIEHLDPIRKNVPTSIPQIRRDFTARFQNGARYLEAAGRVFDQPTFHARRIMELQDLYDDEVLDHFIFRSINENKMAIKDFKKMIKEHNGKIKEESARNTSDTTEITRECSYYENLEKENKNEYSN